ncbi:MAG TPA: cytochrome c [Candidatus Binatia bacterium]|jgi:mono/diheme cytochrome c family protein
MTILRLRSAAGAALLLAGLLLAALPAAAGEPSLSIHVGDRTKVFSRSELLSRATVMTITDDPAYAGASRSYSVVPAHSLFDGMDVPGDAVIDFQCLDGFAAALSRDRLLNDSPSRSIAYLAIEDPAHPWPPLKDDSGPSAGPFYLVWQSPQLSGIAREEWPFQLSGFAVKGSLASVYPKIQPDPSLAAGDPARRGLSVFARNCFACHKLNREGSSDIGPDLNVPMNPTEYLAEPALRRLVRNPQDLRAWSMSRMVGFSPAVLGDADLDDLVAYLRHMAKHKQP